MSALAAMVTVLAFGAMGAGSASAATHPLFLTLSHLTLLITSGEGNLAVLRGLELGVLGTVDCEKSLVLHAEILSLSPLAHKILIDFHGKCEQTIGTSKAICKEPIETKLISAELGLELTNKIVLVLLKPESGTEFTKFTCGGKEVKVEGAIIGEIPAENANREPQYNVPLEETEVVFEAEGKNTDKQKYGKICLLGVEMTAGTELQVSGFFGGKASQEGTGKLKGDGLVTIDTK